MNDRTIPAPVLWTVLAACALATLLTIAIFYQYREVNVWANFVPAEAFKSPGASERIFVDSIFRTRANTWSNLGYVYVGIAAVIISLYDRRSGARGGYLVETAPVGIFFGLSCIALGIGSGIFHASLTRWGQQLDVATMYSTLVALLALNFGRHCPRLGGRPSWPVWIALALVVDILLYIFKWELQSTIVLPGLILSVLLFGIGDRFSRRWHLHKRWIWAGAVCVLLAVLSRGLDRVPPLSNPDLWLKGHAIWHVFTAGSLGCMYFYYRTERYLDVPSDATLQ